MQREDSCSQPHLVGTKSFDEDELLILYVKKTSFLLAELIKMLYVQELFYKVAFPVSRMLRCWPTLNCSQNAIPLTGSTFQINLILPTTELLFSSQARFCIYAYVICYFFDKAILIKKRKSFDKAVFCKS